MALLTNNQIINAFSGFNTVGYNAQWLSYQGNTNVSLGNFRNYITKQNPNFFNVPKNRGNYTGLLIEDISNWINKTQKHYYDFCCSMNITYKNKEQDIYNWYRGTIGEWFLVKVLLNNYSITYIKNGSSKEIKFQYPIPTYPLTGSHYEFGTDCVAIGPNNSPVAIQIKFWNLFTHQKIDYGNVLSHLIADSVNNNEYTGIKVPSSLYIIWTGLKKRDVSIWINSLPRAVQQQIEFIDRNDLNYSIQNNANINTIWQQEVNNWK